VSERDCVTHSHTTLLYVYARILLFVSAYYYIRVRILLYMCRMLLSMCPHATECVRMVLVYAALRYRFVLLNKRPTRGLKALVYAALMY
jgi:hypothetical protein